MTAHCFTRVSPRVIDACHGGSVPLVDRVRALLADGRPRVVCLRGEGKTTALRYIADVFASQVAEVRMPLFILDEEFSFGENSHNSLLLTSNLRRNAEQTLTLAGWGEDEFIEYLLANHPVQCATVMQQLGKHDLSFTRLAENEWEDCDLRGADLRGATFHMGSTRCGLVGSPYPSHGTRTGFYTDTHEDLYHKPPELIRKANLVGCDLRGANIGVVDFYLVDLRGAKYDRCHDKHLRNCGAILE